MPGEEPGELEDANQGASGLSECFKLYPKP